MKNVTDFLKTVETGVDPRLLVPIFALISKPPLSNRANPGSQKATEDPIHSVTYLNSVPYLIF